MGISLGGIIDSVFDKGLDLGFDYLQSGKINNVGKVQDVSQAFTSRRIVYGEHLVPGTLAIADVNYDDDYRNKEYLSLAYVIASQHSDFIKEVRFDDEVMMIGIENAYDHYNSFTWRLGATDSEKYLLGKVRIDSRPELAFQRAHLAAEGRAIRGGVYQYKSGGSWAIAGDDVNGGTAKGIQASSNKFYGLTTMYMRLKHSTSLYPGGIPNMTFLIRGKRIYDPRADATAYSDNYALCVLDFLKAIVGIEDGSINLQSFKDAADICDEVVPTINSETEKRFTVSGLLELDNTPLENLEKLLQAGGGWLSFVQGKWSLLLPVYSAPVMDFTQSDIISSIRFQPKSNKQSRINIARGSYISSENDWDRMEAPTIKVQEYIDNDGEKLEGSFDYDLVSSGYQVQRLNKIKLEQSRYGVVLSAIFKMKALAVTVGDRITLTISNFGWVSKVFQIIKYEVDYSEGVKLTLREDDASIYAWETGDALPIVAPDALNLPDHSEIYPPDSIALSEELYQTNNSREVKARAIIEWAAYDGENYKYDVEIKNTEETEWTQIVWRYQGSRVVFNDIAPANYNLRVRTANDVGFFSDWLEIPVTVLGKTAPPPDLESLFIDGGLLSWTYPAAPLDMAGFEVRIHDGDRQTWADAIPMHSGIISGSRFTLPTNTSGTKTFLVKAIDTSGNYSTNAAIVTVGLGDASIANVILTYDYQANTWPGIITDGTINGSNEIEADQVGAFYNPDGGSIFYNQTGSSDFYDSEYKKLVYLFTYTVEVLDEGSQLTINPTVTADSYQLEYIPPGGGSTYTGFGGYIPKAEEGEYKFRLSIPSQFGSTTPTIEGLTVSLDVPDITETLNDVSISSGGTRLPITKTYRGISYVTLTMQTDGSGVTSLKVDDKDEVLGPLIYAYNTSGTAVSTTIDAFIRGY